VWTPPFGSVLDDPAWLAVIIGVVAIVVSAVVAILVARWQRGPKPVTALSYRATSSALVESRAAGRLRILYEDRELLKGALVTVRVRNSGNQPIPREAFDGPLIIDFGSGADIVNGTVEATHPDTLQPEMEIVPRSAPPGANLKVAPLLLNPAAWFELEVLVERGDEWLRIRVLGNVEGVDEIVDESTVAQRGRGTSPILGRLAPLVSALIAGLATVVAGVAAFADLAQDRDTRIALRAGRELCASEYRLSDRTVVIVEAESGRVVEVPRTNVLAIRRKAC